MRLIFVERDLEANKKHKIRFLLFWYIHRAEDLDSAVLDRCDESLLFPLPDEECRSHLITRYFDFYIRRMQWKPPSPNISRFSSAMQNLTWKKPQGAMIVDDDVMDDNQIRETVKNTFGFSGREIGKLMISMQGAVHSSEKGRLSQEKCQEIIDTKVKEHNEKLKMKQQH